MNYSAAGARDSAGLHAVPVSTMAPVVYTQPGCFGCRKTLEKFRQAGIEPLVVDVSSTPAALEYLTEVLGYSQAPVVVIDECTHWSGLDPVRIQSAIDGALRAAEAGPEGRGGRRAAG